ncbi:hypothetical protein SAMD00019534_013470 [Acytostelium subglobosum LB1]|uniref:hypothetical protein n=1 Tax=Acytostelium subglobosum LB1 TaxID=1410327 RepID=UPI000644EE82|nr:hypothetical protein SAMD00019534_013470 [Acytostelium subglobosum LB1]GAM18172.1 hypothetical protein SAMD00019534_013470 [Acytostelium subglobosum LB1]|eukprot:XP_012758768.1 hypothetical protein SAMD00019534_013470 [Acytostelium subglobosum LB1]
MVDSAPNASMGQWSSQSSMQSHYEAISRLVELKILIKQNEQIVHLNRRFQDNIRRSMADMKNVVLNASKSTDAKTNMSVEDLDKYSKEQWEKVLYFLSEDNSSATTDLISELLVSSNLTKVVNGEISITSEGFKFLLKDVYTQIWTLIIVYLDTLNSRGKSRKEALTFLFKLSFLTLGKGYHVGELTKDQINLLMDLKQFGLVFIRSERSDIFYPTRLVISLTTGKTVTVMNDVSQQELTISQKEMGYIILETNFRVYAYTTSSLQISLLSLFVKMLYRLPNLSVGILTRESIRTALLHGITADQIIEFIRQNGHPNMLKNGYPEIVFEQIKIWEDERNRISYRKAVMFDSFPTLESFNHTLNYARDNNYFMWSNHESRMLVASDDGLDNIKNFIRQNFA